MKEAAMRLMLLLGLTIGGLGCESRPSGAPGPPEKEGARLLQREAPVEAILLYQQPSKPPTNNFYLRLTFTNPHSKPIWLLLVNSDDLAESDTNVFVEIGYPQPFSRNVYFGTGGAVVEVEPSLSPSCSVFRLPRESRLHFESKMIRARTADLKALDVWEVSELRVNGTTAALDIWLPFACLSDKNVTLDANAVNHWLDHPNLSDYKVGSYPKTAVKTLTAEVLHRWKVPVRRHPGEKP
jgi:hypothetical protein